MTHSSVKLLFTLFIFSAISLAAPAAVEPTVTISAGTIIGTATKPINQPSLSASANAYLGVPFAKSPPERFSLPEAASPWSAPLQAQAVKPACIQQFSGSSQTQALTKQFFNNPNGPAPEESEDCLYLNVYTPPGVTPNSKKAVMFWLFGGNLQFGTAGLGFYDGSSLAITQDVVVVTTNYRTNIFGFSNSPEVPFGSQNSGFLDQRFVLQWVQQNIAAFGGDPTRVTLFGESAGGESVKQLLANPPSPRPFSAAILESQNAVFTGNGLTSYKQVLANFGCKDVTCLRKVDVTAIKRFIEVNSLNFPPVDGDGTSIDDVRTSILTRKFANVPTFFGSNLNEGRVFFAVLGLNNGTAAVDGALTSVGTTDPKARQSILAVYTAQGIEDLFVIADRIVTDLIFTCSTSTLSSFLALNGYTTYRYRYDASFPTTSVFAPTQFGTVATQQIDLSAFMQKTWAGFAKNPAGGVGWARVGSALGKELGLLGSNGSSGVNVVNNLVSDYPCVVYAPIGDLLKFTYR
ncbi:liver carboxylesterase 1 precursor [Didymella exigua CBS 183.55]|uniref:Carboxylic ester hydrolase n=1 Tax=Didymella exigua CBS 183.55 TaxID=1150837 RepID=A0A6A5RUF4_9PLEO|nr:liver carboxylesterase 1 precursor [Didymella exigua CBS 183.55]KAF1930784.1 liver carboxylesterase 1 precursor [Didymella exigua CBS 183.55]